MRSPYELSKQPMLAAGLLLAAAVCFAQSNTGSISGVVSDAQGALVAGVRVTVTNDATSVKNQIRTNESGFYSIPNLPIGTYTMDAEIEGFRRYVRSGILLSTSQVLEINARLEVGAVTDTVNVTAEAPLIESRTSDVNQLIESKSIAQLPLGNRRTMNIIQMTGAAEYISDDPSGQPTYSLAGGRVQSQMVWIDGGTGQNIRLGAGQQNIDPPIETVEEIKVLSNNYAAEYGGSAGGVVIETTKSGSNRLAGSLYEYLRNDKFDAPGFFAPVQNGAKIKPELRYNVFGGALGGPIRRNKTFFFAAYEGDPRRTGNTVTLTLPTAQQAAGDFSQTLNAQGKLIPIYDPNTTTTSGGVTTRLQFPNNVVPSNRLDPVAVKALTYYPAPNRAPDNSAGANNFRANAASSLAGEFIIGKVDHNINDNNKLTGRYMRYRANVGAISVFPNGGAADSVSPTLNHSQYFYGSWTRTMGSNKVNDLRYTYTNRVAHQLTLGVGGQYPEKLGLQGVQDNAFPLFSPAGFSNLGSGSQERRQYPIDQHQFVDNFSWVTGRHALKFGFEARRSRDFEINLPSASGAFTFGTQPTGLPGNAATGVGLASMLLGFPTAFSEQQTAPLDRHSWYYAAFFQDDWTVTPSLTLNFGVRWEIDTPMVDGNNRMNGFAPAQINPVSGTPGVIKFAGVNGYPVTAYDFDANNLGPRVGLAWKPFGATSTVIRGGYGIFYAHPFDNAQPNAATLGFQIATTLNSPDNGITAPFFLRNGVPAVNNTPVLNDSYGAVPVGQNPNTAVTYFQRDRRTGYSQQFNLTVEHQLPGLIVLQVGAMGNLSRKLAGANMSVNQIPPELLGPAHQTQKDRPYPQFSDVQVLGPSFGNTNYYAGIARFEKRFSRGLNVVSTYTWSKFLGNTNDTWAASLGQRNGVYSNYYNRRADYGYEEDDIPHRFTFSAVYELPFGAGKPLLSTNPLRYVVGGWAIGTLTTLRSGAPFTAIAQTNTTNAFSAGSLRPNVLSDPNLSSGRTVQRWFNTGVFAQPAAYQFGNEGVDILRSGGLINCDFSLMRMFRIRERVQLQFRGEFFNAFNHTNFGIPGAVFGSQAFGVVSSAGAARQVQVGAHLNF